jgi:NAD(P)-dependent dehydrogenase (short-subunit alcohol dehydrogenase family)
MADAGRLAGRVALITGASRGIGAAVARRFAAEGAHVVLVARTTGGLEETDDAIRAEAAAARREPVPATLVPMDLANGAEIDQMALAVAERFGRLDVLVGNAGIFGPVTPTPQVDPEAWDRAFAVNLTANFRLIRAFEPLLRASDAGRAIFLTTGATRHLPAYRACYGISKLALEALVSVWAKETEKSNIRVNLIDPGGLRTEMHAEAFPGFDPMDFPLPETVTGVFVDMAEPACTRHGETVRAQPNARPPVVHGVTT